MKPNNHRLFFTLLGSLVGLFSMYGFDVPVHDKITEAAVNGSSGLASYLRDNGIDPLTEYSGIIKSIPDFPLNVEALIRLGSINEDYNGVDEGGDRSVNHFYDPTTKQGLSVPSLGEIGLPSETWGTISNALNPAPFVGGFNQYAWQNARAYQSNSIVTRGPSGNRSLQAALMFRSIGQVMHLLQDTAQPQHARNEQHLDKIPFTWFSTPWRSTFEDWGLHNLSLISFKPQDFDWVSAGFTCVSNFWDTGQYNPSVSGTTPLDENENGTITLGLAEYCNGNFLTVRGEYGDLIPQTPVSGFGTSTDYFPISTSTDLQEVEGSPAANATITYLTDSLLVPERVYRCYVNKTSQGAHASPHSVLDLIPTVAGSAEVHGVHADDPDVMSNYYSILIPKAISYSAGLLDYYFRGRLQILSSSISNQTCYFTAENIGPQDMTGGVFRMFTDDISSNRTEAPDLVTSYSTNRTLESGGTITGSFTVTNCYDPDFTLAYFGPIGTDDDGQPLDSVDSNSCASVQFPNPSPCGVMVRLITVYTDDATNGHYAGEETWISAYTFTNAWGTAVTANFHDGNDSEPYQVSAPVSYDSGYLIGAIPVEMANGFDFSDGNRIFTGFMARSQYYLPAPIGWILLGAAENPARDAVTDSGCMYPQETTNQYPMIVDPGLPDWNLTSDGYYTYGYSFFLVGNGPLSQQFPYPRYPSLSAAVAGSALGPSFNPDSVCSGTNGPP